MANKISNAHLNILLNAKKYNTPDIFIALVDISKEYKDKDQIRFLIPTDCNSIKLLKKIIYKRNPNISKQTISNCIQELLVLNLLQYNEEQLAWEIPSMINFLDYGYTNIRPIFLGKTFNDITFNDLTLNEKKLLLYICFLLDTKTSNSFKTLNKTDIKISLRKYSGPNVTKNKKIINIIEKKDSKNVINIKERDNRCVWLKLFNTHSIYYAKNIINKFIKKVGNLIEDVSDTFRGKTFLSNNEEQFQFYFNTPILKNTKESLKEEIERNQEDFDVVSYFVYSYGLQDVVSKNQILQIVRAISTLKTPQLKEYVVKSILNKKKSFYIYKDRKEDIKSIPAYSIAIIRSLLKQFTIHLKEFKKRHHNSEVLNPLDLDSYIDIDNISIKVKDILYA